MQPIHYLVRKTRRPVLMFEGLPVGSSEEEAAQWLWEKFGLNLPVSHLSTKDADSGEYCTLMAILTPEALADMFARSLKEQGSDATARVYFEKHFAESLHELSHRG